MNDLINRQAAIDAVKWGITYARAINTCTGETKELFKVSNHALNEAVERLKELPSAQPETHEKRTETHGVCLDAIDRQAAIDALDKGAWGVEWDKALAKAMIESLPSAQPEVLACGEGELIAQPEIIRCNDCKHWTQTTGNMCGFGLGDCDYINAKLVNCNGFCSWAERRTDE